MPDATQQQSARERATAEFGDFPFLSADVTSAEDVMRRAGYLDEGERVTSVGRAGEGNMNLTLRVGLAGGRSVIFKQSRPWVEKYDAIDAPFDRATFEAAFYRAVAGVEGVADRMPRLLGDDADTRTLLLEDLGEASDLSGVYSGGELDDGEVIEAATYLRRLHDATAPAAMPGRDEILPRLRNREMRALNHAHIFDIPLTDHGFFDLNDLEPGLADAAADLRADPDYTAEVRRLGEAYLADDGPALLHGDFFPGSLLRTAGGLKVIDPEFCFFGPQEFDLGVFVAHLALADRPPAQATLFLDTYGFAGDGELLAGFAGVEIMRRVIGVAQLPLGATDGRRRELLRVSRAALSTDDLPAV